VGLSDVLAHILDYFAERAKCRGCTARDATINILQQQLQERDEKWNNEVRVHHDDMNDIVKHITGMNRVVLNQPKELHSIQRNSSMQQRIARAEAHDREEASALTMQRKREYDQRIAALEKPETELVENG
jgi:tRNA1(Val) A37 N6-methylase TrmN6